MIAVRCPAKINLSLRILGRRSDGYHELDTVFQAVDLWDRLEVRPADDLSLVCEDAGVPTGPENLVLRAASLLREARGRQGDGARFRLDKSIPVQSGLGGGSSDAAGALLACRALWQLDVGLRALAELGARIGADVPFFLTGGTARGRGRGDVIEPMGYPGERRIVLGFPPFGIPTAEVFRLASEKLTPPDIDASLRRLSARKWPKAKHFEAANDLEAVAFERWPELEKFRDALRESGAVAAMLSGSGSTVFGLFEATGLTRASEDRLRLEFPTWSVHTTCTIDKGAHLIG